jgi:uncharacterized membrane protein
VADYSGGGAAFSTNWHGHMELDDGETVFQIEGAWTGTIFFEARTRGGATIPVAARSVATAPGGATVTSLAAGEVGAWVVDSGGIDVRARFAPGTGDPIIRVQDTA